MVFQAKLTPDSRGVPILWLSSKVKTSAGDVPAISFILPNAIASGSEVFNNYGAKSNESLLLGYGFVIPDNPDDTVVLRLGGAPPEAAEALKAKGLDATKRFLVGTDGVIPQELLQVMRILIGSEDADIDMEEDDDDDEHAQHEKEVDSLNAELSVLEMLREMLDDKVEKIIEPLPKGMEARDNVEEMIETYRQGQVDILYSAIEHVDERVERVEKLLEEGPECACGC